jgi:predicted transcriptional regulator YdeE
MRARAPDFERYSEDFDTRSNSGHVEIWIPVGPA